MCGLCAHRPPAAWISSSMGWRPKKTSPKCSFRRCRSKGLWKRQQRLRRLRGVWRTSEILPSLTNDICSFDQQPFPGLEAELTSKQVGPSGAVAEAPLSTSRLPSQARDNPELHPSWAWEIFVYVTNLSSFPTCWMFLLAPLSRGRPLTSIFALETDPPRYLHWRLAIEVITSDEFRCEFFALRGLFCQVWFCFWWWGWWLRVSISMES